MDTKTLEQTFLLEFALLKAMSIREHYDSYIVYVNHDRLFEETRILLDAYKEYYELYPEHKEIDFSSFLTQFQTNWHHLDINDADMEKFRAGILKIQNTNLEDAETVLLGLINKQFIDKVNDIGRKPFTSEDILKALELYDKKRVGILKEYDKDAHTSDDVDFSAIDPSLGIPWYLPPLQETLGGLVAGSLVIVAARRNLGKSAFLHGQVAATLKWLLKQGSVRPVLWFNTEGAKDSVHGRLWSNMYSTQFPGGYREVILDSNKAKIQQYQQKTGLNKLFIVFQGNSMGLNYIRTKVKKYNPSLVILDMASQIAIQDSKNSTATTLEGFFDGLRKLSSEHCPIIGTVQAGVSALYFDKKSQKNLFKKWPTDDDIHNCKTGVQGAAETIIMIGRDNEHEFDRYLQTTKLKSENDPVKFKCELNRKYSSYDFVETITRWQDDDIKDSEG